MTTATRPEALSRPPRAWAPWPREHGAYGQLALPLATALLLARPGSAALLFALAWRPPSPRSLRTVGRTLLAASAVTAAALVAGPR